MKHFPRTYSPKEKTTTEVESQKDLDYVPLPGDLWNREILDEKKMTDFSKGAIERQIEEEEAEAIRLKQKAKDDIDPNNPKREISLAYEMGELIFARANGYFECSIAGSQSEEQS